MKTMDRRSFLAGLVAAPLAAAEEPVIDIHQHTNYTGRTDAELVMHQREMGVSKTVLLPAGSKYGLAAECGGNSTVVALGRQYPKEYVFFANELPDIPETEAEITRYLAQGAIGIGEQKFPVHIDSKAIDRIASIAREHGVPVLLHFEHEHYNMGIDRFHKMAEKYSSVNFIGHAQTWWNNIDRKAEAGAMYPSGPVTPGGITDRLLSDHANVFGDLSAKSGLNSMLRDEDHAREFLTRHQNKLLFGSDCPDRKANGPDCLGSKIIAAVRRLSPEKTVERKLLYGNASRLLKIA